MRASNTWVARLNDGRKWRNDVVQSVSSNILDSVSVTLLDRIDSRMFHVRMTPDEADAFARQLQDHAAKVRNTATYKANHGGNG